MTKRAIEPDLKLAHFCVSFLDLLGQRAKYKDCGLIPSDDSQRNQLLVSLSDSLGSVARLQFKAEKFLEGARKSVLPLPEGITDEQAAEYLELKREDVRKQHWSDGIVLFQSLDSSLFKVPCRGIFLILGLSGYTCLTGLGEGQPLRGGIEVAYGVELNPDEVHGCAMVKAYELESEVAQYPRIVVGPLLSQFIQLCAEQAETDLSSAVNRSMAELCLSIICKDDDGETIVDYLGDGFNKYLLKGQAVDEISKARTFVERSLSQFIKAKDRKLEKRYRQLKRYFDTNLN